MAGNDYAERQGPDAPSTDGLADDLRHLLDQLAVQLSDADQRHTDTVHGMQERIAALNDRATAAKADLPEECGDAFGRVENAMAVLADRLASVEPGQRRSEIAAAEAGSDLPGEVRDDIRRAMSLPPQSSMNAPPVLRSALTAPTAAIGPAAHIAAPQSPLDEPGEEFMAASAVTAASRPAAGSSAFDRGWDNPTAAAAPRLFRTPFEAPQETPALAAKASAGIEPAWLEARLADIAGRVEQSLAKLDPHNSLLELGERFGQLERRFDVALENLAAPAGGDATALQTLEKQITDMVGELARAQKQLGRLDAIESRLTELRQSPNEQQMAQLVSAMKPNDQQLAAVAEAAAERVAQRLRETMPKETTTPAATDAGLGSLTTLLQEFIGEQRQGDAQTAEALDTMQLAMQHLIDRVEAIEAAQSSGHEELLRAAQSATARRADRSREPLELGVRETNLTPAAVSSASDELPRLAVVIPPTQVERELPDHHLQVPVESRYDHDRPAPQRPPVTDTLVADRLDAHEELQPQPTAQTGGETDRDAFIAMARRAADKAARGAPVAPAASAASTAGALGWLKRLTGKPVLGEKLGDVAIVARRPRILLVASFVAFLLAGFWMFTGTGLRGYIAGGVSGFHMAPVKSGPRDMAPARDEEEARTATKASGQAATRDEPASDTAQGRPFPAASRVADGVGIVIDDSHRTSDPVKMMRAREQIQMASLSAKLGEDRPPPSAMTSGLPPSPPAAAMSRAVEMPPALIGPLSLRHAAASGDPAAQLEIGARFAEGKGVPQDFAQAAVWYQRAATHGLATAQYRLGALYEGGLGVQADPARARVWYGRAAEQGNVRAMHNLATLSAGQANGSPEYPMAIQWFSEAANRGLTDSQYNLGVLYERGLGVPASLAEAYKWYALAARSDDKDATRRRDLIRSRLDPVTRDAVDKVVIEWRAKPTDAAANDARGAGQIWRAQPTTQANPRPAQ